MSDLDALVARTEGPQWWRKVVHATNASLIAAALAWVPWRERTVVLLLGIGVVLLVVLDLARLSSPRANALFFRVFTKLASPREAIGIASSTWYAVGIFAAVVLFPRPDAIAGILVMGLADPAAALVGRKLGRHPFLGGTLEGSVAFFLTGAGALALLGYRWPPVLLAALASSLVERRSWPLDDNLVVPVVCAGTLYLLGMVA